MILNTDNFQILCDKFVALNSKATTELERLLYANIHSNTSVKKRFFDTMIHLTSE